MRNINEIIIHCTATPEGRDVSIESIRRWHQHRGFQNIGYHYVIHPNGYVEIGRPIESVGAHCQGHNEHSVGIAYVGGTTAQGRPKDTLTHEQEESLVLLCLELAERYHEIRKADGKLNIHGHNEFSLKRCPCFDVQEKRLRWGI